LVASWEKEFHVLVLMKYLIHICPGRSNPKAKVSVKLVAEAGIGTAASGVSKANTDVI
jgi:hypothetical protein